MDHKVMFKGFESAEEWKQSLAEQIRTGIRQIKKIT